MAKVAVIMGSDSDLPVMYEAVKILEALKIETETAIVSAHRTPDRMVKYARNAKKRGISCIIAGAGGAAHLPGMVASMTSLPVIGVPVMTKTLSGIDSLYSIVQMPGGIPVATVAINNALNAGLLAARIVGTFDEEVSRRVQEYTENLELSVLEKSTRLERLGPKAYLES